MIKAVPAQPVTELAVILNAFLQLLQCRTPGMRLGTFLLRVLDFAQHLTPLLLELRQFLLLNTLQILRFGNPFAQCTERFLLEFEFGMIGNRQRFAFLRQTFAARQ